MCLRHGPSPIVSDLCRYLCRKPEGAPPEHNPGLLFFAQPCPRGPRPSTTSHRRPSFAARETFFETFPRLLRQYKRAVDRQLPTKGSTPNAPTPPSCRRLPAFARPIPSLRSPLLQMTFREKFNFGRKKSRKVMKSHFLQRFSRWFALCLAAGLVGQAIVWISAAALASLPDNSSNAGAVEAKVRNAEEFRQAVARAKPGTRVLLAGGMRQYSATRMARMRAQPDTASSRAGTGAGSAGFQTCCIADFQVGGAGAFVRLAGWETRDTADLEVCVTGAVSDCAPRMLK